VTDRFGRVAGQRLGRPTAEQRGQDRDGAEEQPVGQAVRVADQAEDGVPDERAAAQGDELPRGQLPGAQ